MSLKVKETTPDQALQDYLDTIYIQSHSQASVDSYRTAIIGSKNGFRIFLKDKYNCNEIQLAHRIENDKRELQDKQSKLDQEWNQKNNSIADLIKDGNRKAIKIIEADMERLKDNEKQINPKVVRIQNEQKKLLQSILDEMEQILKQLSKKYDHLKPYFSLINPLDEFSYTYSPHKPIKEQALGL